MEEATVQLSNLKLPDIGVSKPMMDVAELLLAGVKLPIISQQTGISKGTIQKWMRSDEGFKGFLADLIGYLQEEMKIELAVAGREAVEVLRGLLHSKDERIRLGAAKDLADRAGFMAVKKSAVDVTATVNHFATMKDEELFKFIQLGMDEYEVKPSGD